MALEYLRTSQSFTIPASIKFATEKRTNISEQISTYLDTFGVDDWDLVSYTEKINDERNYVVTVVFKKTV